MLRLFPFVLIGWLGLMLLPAAHAEIVSPQWLKDQLTDDQLLIIDVRETEDFLASHVEGSVNLPPMSLFGEGYVMPPMDQLRELFSQLGVDHQRRVVAVDNGDFIWAARLYWVLETLGHDQVYLLDTAWGGWEEGLLPLSQTPTTPARREFIPMVNSERLQTKLGTMAAIGRHPILDGRNETHYLGQESLARRYGHIPTALNYPCSQNYETTATGNRLRGLDVMAEVYAELPKDQPIILYCDGGAEAALNYVVLQALGYQVAVYDGSWVEWGNDSALPVVNPSE